jgi:hypothetical protein
MVGFYYLVRQRVYGCYGSGPRASVFEGMRTLFFIYRIRAATGLVCTESLVAGYLAADCAPATRTAKQPVPSVDELVLHRGHIFFLSLLFMKSHLDLKSESPANTKAPCMTGLGSPGGEAATPTR